MQRNAEGHPACGGRCNLTISDSRYALILLVQDIITVATMPCLKIGRQFKLINRCFTKLTYKSVGMIAIDAMMLKEIKFC